jgi:double-stranded uracil-DNA glycosylase
MVMLPDYLELGLRVVFCGTAAGSTSGTVGHYYAGHGNEFWGTLHQCGLLPTPLGPHLDHRVLEFGIGLTDLAKGIAQGSDNGLSSHYDVAAFLRKMEKFAPRWVAFHGKTAASLVSGWLGHGSTVNLGRQLWPVGPCSVFVVPSMSGANRNSSRLEGKPSREAWFQELARIVGK